MLSITLNQTNEKIIYNNKQLKSTGSGRARVKKVGDFLR